MKNLMVGLFLCIALVARAQQKPEFYSIEVKDQGTWITKIVERKANELVLEDLVFGKITLPKTIIKSETPIQEVLYVELGLINDRSIVGILQDFQITSIQLLTEKTGLLDISRSQIKRIQRIQKDQIQGDSYVFPNPHPTRYFFGPSAIPLKKGEKYFSTEMHQIIDCSDNTQTLIYIKVYSSSMLTGSLIANGPTNQKYPIPSGSSLEVVRDYVCK
jgi:hypothetical protein